MTSAVQAGQRRAFVGISVRHSGHSRWVASSEPCMRSVIALIGLTTKKKTAAAIDTNEIRALRNDP